MTNIRTMNELERDIDRNAIAQWAGSCAQAIAAGNASDARAFAQGACRASYRFNSSQQALEAQLQSDRLARTVRLGNLAPDDDGEVFIPMTEKEIEEMNARFRAQPTTACIEHSMLPCAECDGALTAEATAQQKPLDEQWAALDKAERIELTKAFSQGFAVESAN